MLDRSVEAEGGSLSPLTARQSGEVTPFRGSPVSEPARCHKFSNGLVMVGEPMDWVESAAFTLLAPPGCADDPADRLGLTTLLCEMMFRGAGSRDSRQLVADLDNLGVERGESVSEAHVRLSGATLAGNLPKSLAIFADVILRPHLPGEQIEAARQVVLQNLRAVEDEPADKVMIELRRRHYPDPWGRPPHGEQAALESAGLDDVRRHFHQRCRPNGTILGVAGRLDWPRLVDTVGELLGSWEPRQDEPVVENPSAERLAQLPFDSSQTQIGVAYPSVPYRHPDYFQAWGAVGVLGGGTSTRLFTQVRERRGLCYSVYAVHHTLRDLGGVFCYAGTSADRAQETLEVLLREVIRLRRGIEDHELDRLKARIKSALVMQQESSAARSSAIARDWHLLGRVRSLDEVCRLVDALTSLSINAYLLDHPPRDFTIVTLGPRPLEVPLGIP